MTFCCILSGELGSAAEGKARQSVASAITKIKPTTNHVKIDDNKSNKVTINYNNAEHNHHKYRKQNRPGSPGQLGSSADNSKSISKLLSDNKDSFSDLSVRVLKVSINLKKVKKVTRGEARQSAGEPSLVRIPKSDCPLLLSRESSLVENYSLLGSRLDKGENNNLKANLSLISNNNYSKSVILLSSTRAGEYYLLSLSGGRVVGEGTAIESFRAKYENDNSCSSSRRESGKLIAIKLSYSSPVTTTLEETLPTSTRQRYDLVLYSDRDPFCQDYTFQVSKCYLLDIPDAGLSLLVHSDNIIVTYGDEDEDQNGDKDLLLVLFSLLYLAQAQNFFTHGSSNTLIVTTNELPFTSPLLLPLPLRSRSQLQSSFDKLAKVEPSSRHATVNELMQRICVPLMIDCKVSQATMFTVGALSFQDNNKSNKPLHASFKIDKYQVSTKIDDKFNSKFKSVSKSKLSVRFSDKSETSHATNRLDKKSDDKIIMHVLSAVNIPTLTTCEPTMTLKRQLATVASQTNTVPASQVEKHSNKKIIDDDDDNEAEILTTKESSYLKYDHESIKSYGNTSNHDQKLDCFRSNASTNGDNHFPTASRSDNDQGNNNDKDDYLVEINALESQTKKTERLLAYVRHLLSSYLKSYKTEVEQSEVLRKRLKKALQNMFDRPYSCNEMYLQTSVGYKQRWGIPIVCGLAGGGESSLNTGGAANWGTAPTAAPNNNNATQSSWGGTPGNPPVGSGPPSNWGGNNVNRPVTANPNQNQGPPSGQNNPGEGKTSTIPLHLHFIQIKTYF